MEVNADAERFPDDWLFAHRWKPKTAPARLKFLTIGGRVIVFEFVFRFSEACAVERCCFPNWLVQLGSLPASLTSGAVEVTAALH